MRHGLVSGSTLAFSTPRLTKHACVANAAVATSTDVTDVNDVNDVTIGGANHIDRRDDWPAASNRPRLQ